MQRFSRLVLLCLVALAIPLQGVAALVMATCGPAQPLTVVGSTTVHADHDHHAQQGSSSSAESVREKAWRGAAIQPASMDAANEHDDHGHSDPLSFHKCSACVSCCSGTGFPISFVSVQLAADAPCWVAAQRTTDASFLTSGPDRPPRLLRFA
jgi:hypothetical protein